MKGTFSIRQLQPSDADKALTVMRTVWQDTHVNTGLLSQEVLTDAFPYTSEQSAQQAKALSRQFDTDDETVPRYFGAYNEEEVLVGFVKTGKPLESLRRYGGRESFLERVRRKLTHQKPAPLDPELTEILDLNVVPEHQKKGVGTALVNTALAALSEDTRTIRLFTRVEVMPFFERFGFVGNGERSYYPDPENEDNVALSGMSAAMHTLRRP